MISKGCCHICQKKVIAVDVPFVLIPVHKRQYRCRRMRTDTISQWLIVVNASDASVVQRIAISFIRMKSRDSHDWRKWRIQVGQLTKNC